MTTRITVTSPPPPLVPCLQDTVPFSGVLGTDNTDALQAIHDYLAAQGGGIMHVPASPFAVGCARLPVIDGNRVVLEGEDRETSFISGAAPLLIGMARNDLGFGPLTAADFPPLTMMDGTICGKHGYRTGGKHSLMFPASHWTCGQWHDPAGFDFWAGQQQFTIELACVFNAPNTAGTYAAAVGPQYQSIQTPDPWYLTVYDNHPVYGPCVIFGWRSVNWPASVRIVASYPVSPLGTRHRFTVQVNLAANSVIAWADGHQLNVCPAGPSDSLLASEGNQFGVGQVGYQEGSGFDTTYCGLRVALGCPYAVGAVGSTQSRTDGQSITDASRYLPGGPYDGTIGCLTLAPMGGCHGNPPDRQVTYQNCNYPVAGIGYGYCVPTTLPPEITGATIRDLSIIGGIVLGGATNLRLENFGVYASFVGIDTIERQQPFYPLTIRNGVFNRGGFWDAAIRLKNATQLTIEDCSLWPGARCGIHLDTTQIATVENNFVTDGGTKDLFLLTGFTDSVYIAGTLYDAESGGLISGAMVSCTPTVHGGTGRIFVSGMRATVLGPAACMVRLGAVGSGYCHVADCVMPSGQAFVHSAAGWNVIIDQLSCSKPAGAPWIEV